MMLLPSLKSNAVIASAAWQSSSLKTQSNSGLLRRTLSVLLAMTIGLLSFNPCQAAIEFDGNNDYINLTARPALDFTSSYSFSAWLKSPLPNASGYHGIWWRGLAENQSDIEIYVQLTTNDLIVAHNRGNAGTFDYVGFSDPPNNTWYHLVVTYTGNTINVYYNGISQTVVQQTQSGFIDPLATANNITRLGALGTALGFSPVYFNGQIDDARIYNRQLSNEEVLALYQSRSKRPSGSLANGLVAHYEMDDDAIGEVAVQAKDSSGNLNHGQFIGFDNLVSNGFSNDVPVQMGAGQSLEFDGLNDYIDTVDDGASNGVGPFHFDDSQNWSISTWYKGFDNEINSNYGKALLGRDNGDFWANLVLRNGRVEYIHFSGSWQHNIISNNTINDGQWHFISYVNHSNATGDLYIDSNPDIAGASSVFDDPSRRFVINSIMRGYNNKFTNGHIDDVRIYNRALTSSEISFLYNGSGLDPGTSNLQALWTFDDDSALKDSSENNNHGVGVGGASLKYTDGVLRR